MDQVYEIIKLLVEKGPDFITAIVGVCSALIVLSLMIPGDQPEKFLQSAVEFLSKFSRKK